MRIPKVIGFLFLASLLVIGCRKSRCDEVVPVISFRSFEQFTDNSAKLILEFKDCDGDIGLTQSDSIEPYKYNLYMEYFEKQNGTWVQFTPILPFYYRLPPVYDNLEDEVATEGDIEITMPSYYNGSSSFDTIRFDVHIVDRALNESNTIQTEEIIKP